MVLVYYYKDIIVNNNIFIVDNYSMTYKNFMEDLFI